MLGSTLLDSSNRLPSGSWLRFSAVRFEQVFSARPAWSLTLWKRTEISLPYSYTGASLVKLSALPRVSKLSPGFVDKHFYLSA